MRGWTAATAMTVAWGALWLGACSQPARGVSAGNGAGATVGASAGAPSRGRSTLPSQLEIDQTIAQMMTDTGARAFALAVVDEGRVTRLHTYGLRAESGQPLDHHHILYAASLTKATFAYFVLQLVDEGVLDLDRSIADYLPRPLPEYAGEQLEDRYARWSDLAGDERWRQLTPRILLNHGSGFANFGFLEPDGKLRFHFTPGSRYAYSGDGIILLQFVLEEGLGIDVGREMRLRLFEPLGIADTSLIWREDFAGRAADGWTIEGHLVAHDDRRQVRAAGSMDTTIGDMARLAAAMVKGELLSPQARREFVRPQLPITTATQFPTLQAEQPPDARRADLAAGLGVVVFDGPQGPGYFKGGHNDSTGNTMVCLERRRRCVIVLGSDLRAEAAIPWLVDYILGPTGVPWDWEYSSPLRWRGSAAAR